MTGSVKTIDPESVQVDVSASSSGAKRYYVVDVQPSNENWFQKAYEMLDASAWLSLDDEIEKPTVRAFTNGRRILDALHEANLAPTKVVAAAEGGVVFVFINGARYADIESSNDGDILILLSACSKLFR